jgi:hypothetical protein
MFYFTSGSGVFSPCGLVRRIKSAQYLVVQVLLPRDIGTFVYAMEMRHLRETSGIDKVQPGDIARFWLKNWLKLWTLESKCYIGPPILQNTRMNAP